MITKVLRIHDCIQCPFSKMGSNYWTCRHEGHAGNGRIILISKWLEDPHRVVDPPRWCPLPDEESK